jgi:hypothetical protein
MPNAHTTNIAFREAAPVYEHRGGSFHFAFVVIRWLALLDFITQPRRDRYPVSLVAAIQMYVAGHDTPRAQIEEIWMPEQYTHAIVRALLATDLSIR